MLLSKEEDHATELQEREQIIVKLQQVIAETAEANKKVRNELEHSHKAELESVCERHDSAVKEIKEKLLKTQEDRAEIANVNAQYKS